MRISAPSLHGEGETDSPFTVWYDVMPSNSITTVGVPKKFGLIAWTRTSEPPGMNKTRCALFYDTLQQSVAKHGFRNPILCWNMDILYCIYGTSRLYAGHNLDIDIPTFIVDFKGDWSSGEQIFTEEQALSKFTEEPTYFQFTDKTFNFCNEKWHYDILVRKERNLNQFKLMPNEELIL